MWESLRILHDCQISHGDLRSSQITVDDDVLFGGFDNAEYGATDAQLRSDIAQLLVTTTYLYDAPSAVRAAIDAFGKDVVLTASRRLTTIRCAAGVSDNPCGMRRLSSPPRATR